MAHIKDFTKEIPGALSTDEMAWEFPTIDATNIRGKKTFWKIIVKLFDRDSDNTVKIEQSHLRNNTMPESIVATINVQSGQVGGKIRKAVPTIVSKGKNIGKASQTNVLCQALRDALGLYNKQLRKAGTDRLPPMLAQTMPVDFDAAGFVQRKYDGMRVVSCLENGEVICYSRRTIVFTGMDYLKKDLAALLNRVPGLHLDGEIYKHGVNLQTITTARSSKSEVKWDYYVYDCFFATGAELFSARQALLDQVFANQTLEFVKRVETIPVANRTMAEACYKQFREEGYEGAIFRLDAPYVFSRGEYHSANLLKMKPTFDGEFKVVGWETGSKGKAARALMIKCITEKGKEFTVTPAMSLVDRENLAVRMACVEENGKTHFENEWLGTWIIVYYDALSTDNVPQRARTSLQKRVD